MARSYWTCPWLLVLFVGLSVLIAMGAAPPGGSTPPPNPAIAYADSGIKVMNADGTNQRTVVSLRRGEYAGFPAWSPDSSQLTYLGTLGGVTGVWTVPVAGGASHLVATTAAPSRPDWSPVAAPDGRFKIVYIDATGAGSRNVFIVNPDGTGRMNLTNTSEYHGDASWAPDGRHLVVTRHNPSEVVVFEIDLVNGLLAIVSESVVYMSNSSVTSPRWANTTDQLAFTIPAGTSRVATLDLNDPFAVPVLVTSNAGYEERSPSFSPDDTRLAFQRLGTGGGIFVINANGTGQIRINSRGTDPNWRRTP